MKKQFLVSPHFFQSGILLLCLGLLLGYLCADAAPVLLEPSSRAMAVTEDFMEALQSGDLDSAGTMLSGQPRLRFEDAESGFLTALLWDAYTGSLQFAFGEELTPTDSGCCRTVTVTALDISALMEQLKKEAPALLAEATAAIGEDLAFGEDNHYRQDFVTEVLYRRVQEYLKGACPTVSREYRLEMVLQEDAWQILPSQELLDLICGKIA